MCLSNERPARYAERLSRASAKKSRVVGPFAKKYRSVGSPSTNNSCFLRKWTKNSRLFGKQTNNSRIHCNQANRSLSLCTFLRDCWNSLHEPGEWWRAKRIGEYLRLGEAGFTMESLRITAVLPLRLCAWRTKSPLLQRNLKLGVARGLTAVLYSFSRESAASRSGGIGRRASLRC